MYGITVEKYCLCIFQQLVCHYDEEVTTSNQNQNQKRPKTKIM